MTERLTALQECLPDKKQVTYIHRIDNCLFCHGGISEAFVKGNVENADALSVDEVLEQINHFGRSPMWDDDSPLWLRPQDGNTVLWHEADYLQVVGHTPMREITRTGRKEQK